VCLLAAEDCYRLGSVAYFNQDYYHTVMWITEALNIWQTEKQKTIGKSTLLDYLSYSLYMVSLLAACAARLSVIFAFTVLITTLQAAPLKKPVFVESSVARRGAARLDCCSALVRAISSASVSSHLKALTNQSVPFVSLFYMC